MRTADLAPLPEDEAAGLRSGAQWREHLEEEERERQTLFDRARVPQHRALAHLIADACQRYEAARNPRELAAAERAQQRFLHDAQQRLTQIDPWGVNSRLLPTYDALLTLLEHDYPQAKRRALRGERSALQAVRAASRAHLEQVDAWLEQVEEEDERRSEAP